MKAIRILIVFTSYMEFKLFQMNIKSAFLNSFLKKKVFVKQPPRFENVDQPNHVFKSDKCPYGLEQAPRAWYGRLSKFLFDKGFKRQKIDNTLFLKVRQRNLLIFQVYVDDIICGATTSSLCDEFSRLMSSKFEMSITGELKFFLGLQIKHGVSRTTICQ